KEKMAQSATRRGHRHGGIRLREPLQAPGCGKRQCFCENNTKTSINLDLAPVVVRVFEMLRDGFSYSKLSKRFKSSGVGNDRGRGGPRCLWLHRAGRSAAPPGERLRGSRCCSLRPSTGG